MHMNYVIIGLKKDNLFKRREICNTDNRAFFKLFFNILINYHIVINNAFFLRNKLVNSNLYFFETFIINMT